VYIADESASPDQPLAAGIELRRQSVPLPSLLPSLNQIGLALYYPAETPFPSLTAGGGLQSISLKLDKDEELRGEITALLMVNTYPADGARIRID
jgi:hypothetical protein